MRSLIAAGLMVVPLCLADTAAIAAPPQLLNKTVLVSWSESAQQKLPDGRTIAETISRTRTVYVSSAGRVFVKAVSRGSGGGGKSEEVAPGSSNTSLNFKGNTLVGHAVFAGFARQVVVTFDPAFSSCSVNVTYGRSGGPRTWKSYDGQRTIELLSLSVGGTSCSIRDGNALAS